MRSCASSCVSEPSVSTMSERPLKIANIPRNLSNSAAHAVLITALCILVYVIVRSFIKRPRSQRHIVFAGPCGAGKTALFTKLVFGSNIQTCTSTKENEGVVTARWDKSVDSLPRSLLLIDTPGLPSIRARLLSRSVPKASGVVFLCDPVGGLTSTKVRETVDALHLVLALIERTRTQIPLLVLCSRADTLPATTKAATINRAKAAIEREMERRRAALASGGSRGPTRLDALGAKAGAVDEAEDETEIVASSGVLAEASTPWSFADVCPQATFGLVGRGELDEFWAWA